MTIMAFEIENGKFETSPLYVSSVREKISILEAACHNLLSGQTLGVPTHPQRDVEVVELKDLPNKKGLSSFEGQARLLHDLASIELQAMELAFRSLCEFPEAPLDFKEELAQIAIDEGRHLEACLKAIENLGYEWGSWPVHLSLWKAVSIEDSLLDRLIIVHRFLEGSGLDAGDTLLTKLSGVPSKSVRQVVKMIHDEELGHVQFGSRWFKKLCNQEKLDCDNFFCERVRQLKSKLPRRLEPIKSDLRLRAGFSLEEINALNDLRTEWMGEI